MGPNYDRSHPISTSSSTSPFYFIKAIYIKKLNLFMKFQIEFGSGVDTNETFVTSFFSFDYKIGF